jgi:hypothetical protein
MWPRLTADATFVIIGGIFGCLAMERPLPSQLGLERAVPP